MFLVGHTHKAELEQQPGVTVINGGSIGAGGTGNLGESTNLSIARFVFTLEPTFQPLAADLVSIDPGTGNSAARREIGWSPKRSLGSRPVNAELLELDRTRVWHPYGPMPAAAPPLPVVSAQGVRLTLADGRELVDGMASLVVRDPRLPAPGDRRGGQRPARPHGARDVRRAHARAGDPARGAADGLDRARPRVLRRLAAASPSRSRSSSSCSTGTASGARC